MSMAKIMMTTAHAGYSHLVYAERVDAGITLRFSNLLAFQ